MCSRRGAGDGQQGSGYRRALLYTRLISVCIWNKNFIVAQNKKQTNKQNHVSKDHFYGTM